MIARRVAKSFSAQRGATLIGTAHRAPPDWATFANGLVRYLDSGNIVTVRLRDNRQLREHVDYPPGHAKNPLRNAQLEVKFHSLADSEPRTGAGVGRAP